MAKDKGGGGNKGGGGGQPSGGGGGGGNKPSGGGGQPSGGGGGQSSGGGRPSAPSSPSPAPSSGGGGRPSAPSTPSAPSGGGGGQSKQEQKVTQATKDIKGMIAGITAEAPKIADPKAYQKALDVLRGAGKEQRVETLKGKVQTARELATKPTTLPAPDDKKPPGLTQADIDAAINKFKEDLPAGLSPEDLQSALDTQRETLMSEFGDWKQQYANTTSQMQQQREEATATPSTASTDLSATDISSQFEAFDPELFSSLLGELESSKRRQKDWNELSAKAAFKY